MDEALLAEHVDAIHAVGRDEFVAERDRRVRELRAEGHREEATALKGHRKATVPAWAVNQLARREQDRVAQLVEAGDALRTAQRRATSGRGADELRRATRRVRDLTRDLASRARELLDAQGAASGHVDHVQQTLFAAAVDPALHETLRRGVFSRPVEAAGFGVMAGLAAVPDGVPDDAAHDPPRADHEAQDVEDAETAGQRRQREEVAARAARRRTLERQRADLQRSMLRQQRRAERARDRADDLQARADDAAAEARAQQAEQASIARELDDVERELGEVAEAEMATDGA